jgi:hypothetical protein
MICFEGRAGVPFINFGVKVKATIRCHTELRSIEVRKLL